MNCQLKKPIIFTGWVVTLCILSFQANAQSIIGRWQLVKQSNCIDESMTASNDGVQDMVDDMKSMAGATPQVVTFKEKQAGEESTRILNRKKSANTKNFLYKFNGEMLMILDKKSQTITDNYMVDKFSADSLIISNAARPCETRIFLRIK
jgi:hypothetical protein